MHKDSTLSPVYPGNITSTEHRGGEKEFLAVDPALRKLSLEVFLEVDPALKKLSLHDIVFGECSEA